MIISNLLTCLNITPSSFCCCYSVPVGSLSKGVTIHPITPVENLGVTLYCLPILSLPAIYFLNVSPICVASSIAAITAKFRQALISSAWITHKSLLSVSLTPVWTPTPTLK